MAHEVSLQLISVHGASMKTPWRGYGHAMKVYGDVIKRPWKCHGDCYGCAMGIAIESP